MTGSRALSNYVDEAGVRRVCGGFVFTEGPVWLADQRALLFSDMRGATRHRWSEADGTTRTVAEDTHKGNGMTLGRDGRLLVCEHVTSSLVAMDPAGDGTGREVLASHYEGRELNSPNDVVSRSDGSIWFTDPTAGRRNNVSGLLRDPELDFQAVFRLEADGSLEPVARDFELCNGLAFSPEEQHLYVTDTYAGLVWRLTVRADRTVTDRVVLNDQAGRFGERVGWLDGLRCDEDGNIWTTAPGGVWILSPSGERLATIPTPEAATNLCWGGGDGQTLFITATTSVYAIRTTVHAAGWVAA